jgi:hypothetical protein
MNPSASERQAIASVATLASGDLGWTITPDDIQWDDVEGWTIDGEPWEQWVRTMTLD